MTSIFLYCLFSFMLHKVTMILSFSALFYGGVTIAMSFVAPYMGDLIIQIVISIYGTAGGPLFGLFCLGIFFPFVNSVVSYWHISFHFLCQISKVLHTLFAMYPLMINSQQIMNSPSKTLTCNYLEIQCKQRDWLLNIIK